MKSKYETVKVTRQLPLPSYPGTPVEMDCYLLLTPIITKHMIGDHFPPFSNDINDGDDDDDDDDDDDENKRNA